MRDTGVVRKLDELGRITIPMEIRKSFGIEQRDPLHIYVEGNRIILEKDKPSDIFSGEEIRGEDYVEYQGKLVSKKNVEELARIAGLL